MTRHPHPATILALALTLSVFGLSKPPSATAQPSNLPVTEPYHFLAKGSPHHHPTDRLEGRAGRDLGRLVGCNILVRTGSQR